MGWKKILQVPDTDTRVLDNTRPFLCSIIVSFWITLACSKERKDHIFGQCWYTKNVPVLTNTRTFQYLGPEVYFFRWVFFFYQKVHFYSQISERSTCTHLHHSELDKGDQCHLETVETFPEYSKTTWCEDSAALHWTRQTKLNWQFLVLQRNRTIYRQHQHNLKESWNHS